MKRKIDALILLLDEPSSRLGALQALGTLVAYRTDVSEEVSQAAALARPQCLREIRGRRALLHDPDPEIRAAALQLLHQELLDLHRTLLRIR